MQAGYLPFVDVVRVKDGKAIALNVVDGEESEDVSARARGFLSMLESFQDKVSLLLLSATSVVHSCRVSSPT